MGTKLDVKNTKELSVALIALGAVAYDLLKDGAQLDDLWKLWELKDNESLMAKIKAGIDEIGLVDDEIADADAAEYVEIAAASIEELVALFKK